MYILRELASNASLRIAGGYRSLINQLFSDYTTILLVPSLSNENGKGQYVNYMTRPKGSEFKIGRSGSSQRVGSPVHLPGYDPKTSDLKTFICQNYGISSRELKRVMKDFREGRKDRAMRFLQPRRRSIPI